MNYFLLKIEDLLMRLRTKYTSQVALEMMDSFWKVLKKASQVAIISLVSVVNKEGFFKTAWK